MTGRFGCCRHVHPVCAGMLLLVPNLLIFTKLFYIRPEKVYTTDRNRYYDDYSDMR